MLKVVGASWLQTRISTYILLAVALLGIGVILIGEFGRVENDGTYSATVFYKRRSGCRIDFWGQSNDLSSLPLGAARAYYKTGIMETGWSIVEIETSPDYPDEIQAYSAGLLEGSLTWQLIHHHWYNTVRAACAPRASLCRKMRKYLKENAEKARENAKIYKSEDPYWHMVHLYYKQLEGLQKGWKYGVSRSRKTASIESEDFLWLAMASDLPDLERASTNKTEPNIATDGFLSIKSFDREHFEPLIALAHSTAAPYAKMLRLIKRYKFNYHTSPDPNSKIVPGSSVVMTSYPGALSSLDEYYLVSGQGEREFLVAGTPLNIENNTLWSHLRVKEQVMSPARIMAANRLSMDGLSWSRILDLHNSGTSSRQWIGIEARKGKVCLVEQIPGFTKYKDISNDIHSMNFLALSGLPITLSVRDRIGKPDEKLAERREKLKEILKNATTLEEFRKLFVSEQVAYRADLENVPRPVGIIDEKLALIDFEGVESFEARSGPPADVADEREDSQDDDKRTDELEYVGRPPYDWSKTFTNSSHKGQPEVFKFEPVKPIWVWV